MKNIAYSTVRTACDGITRHMSSVGMRHTSQKTWNNPARAMTHATVSSAMGFHEAILRHLAPTRMRVGMITGEWSLGGGNTMGNKRIDI